MNELTKYNRLSKRTCFDEIIIKKGLFLLPNTYLVLHDNTQIIFRNTDENGTVEQDLDQRLFSITQELKVQQDKIETLQNKVIELESIIENTNIDQEQFKIDIKTELNKFGFISVCEAEGILENNSFPFSYGMGTQSSAQYGLPFPYDFTIRGISYSSITNDINPKITIRLLFYPFFTSTATILLDNIVFENKFSNIYPKSIKSNLPGNIVIQIISTTGLTDENSKFRISIIFTSNSPINRD